jgi:hypothetical protein
MTTRMYRTTDISRERNRVHAQRTRLRKKEHMQTLQYSQYIGTTLRGGINNRRDMSR